MKTNIVGSNLGSSGMGDILVLTSVCRHLENCEVQLPFETARFARFFKDICDKVVITETPDVTPDEGEGHFAKAKLRHFGIETEDYLPIVKISDGEMNRGFELIKDFENPIVFVPNCSVYWAEDRQPQKTFLQGVLNKLQEDHTVLQFGLSRNWTEFEGTIPMMDKSIFDLICYYSAIGKYTGVCTGDSHLMLAVGGECDIYVPRTSSRNRKRWDYTSDKVRYHYV
tara:strand:+ start:798 stop:1475 length:678 start_codon:yes stop_codon:yes gene_type:complete